MQSFAKLRATSLFSSLHSLCAHTIRNAPSRCLLYRANPIATTKIATHCAHCCSLQAPELSRMLALLVAVSWMPAAVFETAAENEILATVTGAGGGTAALVASAPRVEVSPCTGKSARLPTPQCAAWQAFHDSTMGRRWRVCADARNDPCACAGYDGASPTCNTAGTAITQMCVLPCCICVQGRHSPTPPFLQLIPALVTTPLYITPASCGTVASRAHCPLS